METSSPDPRINRGLKISSYAGMFGIGIRPSAIGPLLIPIPLFFHLGDGQMSYPVVCRTAGYLLGTILISFV